MNYNVEKYRINIVDHYKKNWGNIFKEQFWFDGPIKDVVPHFSILEYPPSSNRDMWTYATCGMSTYTHKSPIELHLFSSNQDDSLIELLSTVCYYHNIESNLDLGHTVNFGRPWQNSSQSSFGLISLPYLDGPDLEIMRSIDKDVHFYWLIPITETELRYKKEFGLEALEAQFDAIDFNYLAPNRKSVV